MPENFGIEDALKITLAIAAVIALIWIALGIVGWMQRRAYSLSPAESSGAQGLKPDFLKVNTAARDAAMARGAAFDAGQPLAVVTPVARAAGYSGIIALLAALLSFITAAFAAMQKVGVFQKAFEHLSSWDRFVGILSRYSAGFTIAGVIIILQLLHYVFRLYNPPKA